MSASRGSMMLRRAGASLAARRMFSTIVGHSGRVYGCRKVLQHHPSKPALDIHLAVCDKKPYVVKPVSPSIFELLQEFKNEFSNNPRLRVHVDHNECENVLVYEYFKSDLLSLVENYSPLSIKARKAILKEVGLALREMHEKGWIHLGVKPNNVFLNWYVDKNDHFQLQKVALGDMDCALKLEHPKLLNTRIGNVMWRSPEGQLGKGIGTPSEVFSFGLLCLYVITGAQCFHPDFDKLETEPEPVILYRLLSDFGPLPEALVKHVDDEEAEALLRGLWQAIAEDESNEPFEQWSEDKFSNLNDEAKGLIARMTHLAPAKRARMSDIMIDSYWR